MYARLTVILVNLCYVLASERKCSNTQFECDDGECIPKTSWCIEHRHRIHYHRQHETCDDGSNQLYCSQTPYECYEHQGICVNNGKCIPEKWICDGYSDCSDSSDERNCLYQRYGFVELQRIKNARDRAIEWITKQRRPNWGWEQDTARAIISLYFNYSGQYHTKSEEGALMLKQAKIQILEMILRSSSISVLDYQLANYVHTLLAMCHDPTDFLGENLIEHLREGSSRSSHLNPFLTLVLCNSNSSLPSSVIKKLFEIILKPTNPERIDRQAYSAMTLSCLQRRNLTSLENAYQNFLRQQNLNPRYNNITKAEGLFRNLQQEDGSYGSISTTAIVIQALLSGGYYGTHNTNFPKAYEYILRQQKPDGSFGNMMQTYLVVPLLYYKTLLDLGNVNCSQENRNPRYLSLREEFELRQTQKQKVVYSIWLGENKDISFQMAVTVPINVTFYDVMRLAAELDTKYNFQYVQYHNGKYVYSIFNVTDDPEASIYWYLYFIEGNDMTFAGDYPDKVIPKDGENFIYWYRHHGASLSDATLERELDVNSDKNNDTTVA